MKPTRGAVESVEDDPLDRRIEAAARVSLARPTRVGELRPGLPSGALAQLDRHEPQGGDEQSGENRESRSRPTLSHGTILRRKRNATKAARAASPADRKNAGRNARVIVFSIVATSESRVAASCLSCRAP